MNPLEPTALQETTNINIDKIKNIFTILEKYWPSITSTACGKFNNGIVLSLDSIKLSMSVIPILFRQICDDMISLKPLAVKTKLPQLIKNIDIAHAFVVGMLLSNSAFFTEEEVVVLADIDDIRMKYLMINYEFIKRNVRT